MALWNIIFGNCPYIEMYNLLSRWPSALECVCICHDHIDHETREKIFFCDNNLILDNPIDSVEKRSNDQMVELSSYYFF